MEGQALLSYGNGSYTMLDSTIEVFHEKRANEFRKWITKN